MAFRHFFRHSYSFEIDHNKLIKLVKGLTNTWNSIKADILNFLNSL
jgi:hypothetical protein